MVVIDLLVAMVTPTIDVVSEVVYATTDSVDEEMAITEQDVILDYSNAITAGYLSHSMIKIVVQMDYVIVRIVIVMEMLLDPSL